MTNAPGGQVPQVAPSPAHPLNVPGVASPLALASAAPPPPMAVRPGGGRVLAALLVIQAVLVLTFFVVGIIAVWIRAGRDNQTSSEPTPSIPAAAGDTWVAIVELPRKDQKKAALRPSPSFDNEPMQWIPVGSEVDVLACNTVATNWCRVRTRAGKLGWMHAPALRRK